MRHTSIARQLALVSHGTQFLRGHAALEDWHRHGVFSGARLQFRAPDGNALLADDFTWWLGILRQSGALRLSLHLPAEFGLDAERATGGGAYAVAVHFADRHEIWIVGRERAAWHEHPLLPDDGRYPAFPDAAHWGGELDSYWRVVERPRPRTICWRRSLYAEQAKLSNEMHPKNENSAYHHMDEAGAVALENRGRRLDSWIIEAELRCANECRDSATFKTAAPSAAPAAGSGAAGTWRDRLAFAIATAAGCLFVAACAHLIVRFPWLAIPIGPPYALHVRYNKRRRSRSSRSRTG